MGFTVPGQAQTLEKAVGNYTPFHICEDNECIKAQTEFQEVTSIYKSLMET